MKRKIGKIITTVILIVAIVALCISAYQLYKIYSGYKKGDDEYEDLQKAVQETEQTENAEDGPKYHVDFDALRAINPDVVAWIRFEEPEVINYPVVQGKDNSEYLYKTFKGYDNTVGTLFVNYDNAPDFSDRNTIIYGHYMYNGSMFNELEQYAEKSFWDQHPYFYIYTPDGAEITYHIYSAGVISETSDVYTYQFADDAMFEAFLAESQADSNYETGVVLDVNSQVLTLSTCTRSEETKRFVVHAVKEEVKY